MILEGHIYCEAADCEAHAHVGPDTMRAERLPIGWVRLIEYEHNGREEPRAFCGPECAMKFCAAIEPPEVIQ